MIAEQQFEEIKARWKIDVKTIAAGYPDPMRIDHRAFGTAEPIDGLPQPSEILDVVCSETGFTRVQMCGRRRNNDLVRARRLYAVIAEELTGANAQEIAAALGKSEGSNVHFAVRKGRELIQYDEKTRQTYLRIKGFFGE